MLVYGGNCQQRRDCNMVFIHTAVGKNQDIRTLPVRLIHLYEQMLQHAIHRCALIENDRHTNNLKAGLFIVRIFNRSRSVRIGLLIFST